MPTAQVAIFAGGHARRLGELRGSSQKCLFPIDGIPILDHILLALVQAFGSVSVTICVSYKADQVKEHIDKSKPNKVKVQYLYDEGHSRTADLIRGLEGHIHGQFLVISGDLIVLPYAYENGLRLLIEEKAYASVTLSPMLDEADTHAVGKVNGIKLTSLILPAPKVFDYDHLRDMTLWGIDERVFSHMRQHPALVRMPHILNQAIRDGEHVVGHVYKGHWVHVAYPDDLKKSMQTI